MTNFEAEVKKQRLNHHKEVLKELCVELHNCADCYNEETRRVECDPLRELSSEVYQVTENGFLLEPYSSQTNRKMVAVADRCGYQCGLTEHGTETWLKFLRQEGEYGLI